MKTIVNEEDSSVGGLTAPDDNELPFLLEKQLKVLSALSGVVVGELAAIAGGGRVPLVTYPGQETAGALPARSTVDLDSRHVGKPVVLLFESGDPLKPIVIGTMRTDATSGLEQTPGHVEVDADGKRLIVSAQTQILLRCGEASITLKKNGEIVLRGTRLSSHASGVNRIKGGSVQIN